MRARRTLERCHQSTKSILDLECYSCSDVSPFFMCSLRLKCCWSFAKASTCIFQYLNRWSLPRWVSNILRVKTRVVKKPCNAQSWHVKIWKCADWQQTCWDACCDYCVALFSLRVGLDLVTEGKHNRDFLFSSVVFLSWCLVCLIVKK